VIEEQEALWRCLEPDWEHHALRDAKRALARVRERGEAKEYGEAHLVARLHLGLLDPLPVACVGCGVTDWEVTLQAALDWEHAPPARLRTGARGEIFSAQPELDYNPMCIPCHKRRDSWRKALPFIKQVQQAAAS
jgi:hypothetical protein